MDAIETTVDEPMDEAEAAIRQALSAEGFGVLTEIDVAATLREKLGVERAPLKILGACNPVLAHRALDIDPSLALVLPCNVVLEDLGDGRTRVAVVDPHLFTDLADKRAGADDLRDLTDEAAGRLRHAVDHLRA